MTQIIAGNAPDQKNWDVADAMPGGASNWGGSFLLVPGGRQERRRRQAARRLADRPEAGRDACSSSTATSRARRPPRPTPSVTGKTDAYFGGAPTGQIFSNRFAPIAKQPYRGSHYFAINEALADAYTRVDVDKTDDAASSWKKFEQAVKDLS